MVDLTSRILTSQQFVWLAGSDQFIPARGLDGCRGFRVRIARLEWQGLSSAMRNSSKRRAPETVSLIFFSASAFILARSPMRVRTDVLHADLTKTSASADGVDTCHPLGRDGWKSWLKRFQNPAVNPANAAKEVGMKLTLWRAICLVCVVCALTVIGLPEPSYRSGQKGKVTESLIFDEAITIVGSGAFVDHVMKALTLLRSKSPSGYPVVKKYIGRIKEGTTSGMYAYYTPPTFQMSAKEALLNESNKDYALQWCASVIVHDAYHSKKYHDYQEAHGHSPGSYPYPPIYVWTGEAVERECLAFQKKVCGEIGAYQTIREYLEKCDGRYCKAPRSW